MTNKTIKCNDSKVLLKYVIKKITTFKIFKIKKHVIKKGGMHTNTIYKLVLSYMRDL